MENGLHYPMERLCRRANRFQTDAWPTVSTYFGVLITMKDRLKQMKNNVGQ
jgi:hypothetical protein